jgi:hypothetical protein
MASFTWTISSCPRRHALRTEGPYFPDGTDLARTPGVSAQATLEQEPENKLYIPSIIWRVR